LPDLLYGSTDVQQLYEVASSAAKSERGRILGRWQRLHDPSLRRLEAVCFRLAAQWFGCSFADEAKREIEELPRDVALWCEQYGESPLLTIFMPNKDALWLHLSLIESAPQRRRVFLARAFPFDLPTVEAVETIQAGYTGGRKRSTSKFAVI